MSIARLVAALLVVLLVTSSLSATAFAQSALTVDQINERLDEWEQAYARLKREIWNLQRGTPMFGHDFRGRTLSDDLREFVLTKPTEQRINDHRELLATQLSNGDTKLATATLVSLYSHLRDQIEILERIGELRLRYRQVAEQRALWQQRVATMPNYQAPDAIRSLEQQAVQQLNVGRFEQINVTYGELLQAYANEGERLFRSGAKLVQTSLETIVYERRSPCDNATKVNSNKPMPALISTTHPDYPATSKTAGEEGTVYIQLLVSGSGCPLRYGIRFSSGWLNLDDASLAWIETLQFVPATNNGKAVDAWVTLPVAFRLKD